MLRRYKPKHFTKIVTDADVPEFLHDNEIRMYGLTFIAEKTVGEEDNTGDIYIQVGGEDALRLEPGRQTTWPQPPYEAGFLMPQDFKVRVENDGDAVRVLYNELV